MPLADGQSFADYTILRQLGSGGMGEVYLAQHPRLPRQDALKVLPVDVSGDEEYVIRFHREADIAATLFHPNIVGVHDRGEFGGQLWIAMDFVEGTDAAVLLQEKFDHGLPPDVVVGIIKDIGAALDYAHHRWLLHRDVKPSNILLAPQDSGEYRALLADFGIARFVDDATGLTGTNMTVGTVAYAAPEQLMAENVDGRADQYALAATAFHLLTGSQPFQHSNPAVVISQHLTAPPPAIAERVPELRELGPVFSKALAKSPDDRYATCTEFARALEQRIGKVARELGSTEATMASHPASLPRHRRADDRQKRPKVSRLVVALSAVAALLVVAVAVLVVALWPRPQPAPQLIVRVGAPCATLGQEATAATGGPAYCANDSETRQWFWSEVNGEVPEPTKLPTPTGTEDDVTLKRIASCQQQTGRTEAECREDIRSTAVTPSPS